MSATMTWHLPRPAVYLDQWTWVRLGRAHHGHADARKYAEVLQAVCEASADGVLFPLSATHVEETLRVRNPGQRRRLVEVMAPISHLRTLRSQSDLVRHQILNACHETCGRPFFRPTSPEVLGHGVSWALRGVQTRLGVLGPDGAPVDVDRAWLRHANQYFDALSLAGPTDEDIPNLVSDGYVHPLDLETRPGNRLSWEEFFAGQLEENRPSSRTELRRWLLGRELAHEYHRVLNSVLNEHRLSLSDITRTHDPDLGLRRAVDFAERIPTMRVAAEIKFELFLNPARKWSYNMVRDIDALSVAIPYCHVVVTDKDASALAQRTGAPQRLGSLVTSNLLGLPEHLQDLRAQARLVGGDPTGWDAVGPGDGYRLDRPPALTDEVPPGFSVRLCDPDGRPSSDVVRELQQRT